MTPWFMFATGIEGSCPTIDAGQTRMDQFESCGHYRHWRTDFELVRELGLQFLRYGPPLHRTWTGADRYDWTFADETFGALKAMDICPIADLCHFGVPDWIGDFQNPDFPDLFAAYAGAFAERFPWVQLYTPVNEIFVCASFSARLGWWNEQQASERSFVTALKHLAMANVLAMEAVLRVRPDALFVQSESTEYFHADGPDAIALAETLNLRRFLSLDLSYGHWVESPMYAYLLDNGMTRAEYEFFMDRNVRHHCIMGNDYYLGNEHRVTAAPHIGPAGEVFGYDEITRQYYERYRLPVMHTETNRAQGPTGQEAADWLWKQWANVLRVRNSGVPIVGFTWYSLTDQTDWDHALREKRDRPFPVGLYDLDRNIRPVGRAYKELVEKWRDVLPAQSVCLNVPVVFPSETDEPFARRRREWMRAYHARYPHGGEHTIPSQG